MRRRQNEQSALDRFKCNILPLSGIRFGGWGTWLFCRARRSSRSLRSSTSPCMRTAEPVSAKALAAVTDFRPRHLEPVLQAFVRDGILKGIRGPRRRLRARPRARARSPPRKSCAPPARSMTPTRRRRRRRGCVERCRGPGAGRSRAGLLRGPRQVSVADMVRRAGSLPRAGLERAGSDGAGGSMPA